MNGNLECSRSAEVGLVNPVYNIITASDRAHTEIVRIGADGHIYWRGREVETDDEFRSAMLDLAKVLAGKL